MTRTVPSARRRSATAALLALGLLSMLIWAPPVALAATTIVVNTVNQEINRDGFCSLQEAIYAANLDDNVAPDPSDANVLIDTACPAGSGHDVIELPPMGVFQFSDPINDADNYLGPTATPIILSDITIEGRGARLERLATGRLTRAFAVGGTGFLDLREVHVKGFSIHGGNGDDGGGGGMGAGGAIFVVSGRLLVQWSTFQDNLVEGGDGSFQPTATAGGGGGLSGNGGSGADQGGGGGGSRGNGSSGRSTGDDNISGAGGGRVTSAVNENPGLPCGARGNFSSQWPVPDGADNGFDGGCAGGGGSGGTNREPLFDPVCGGAGGDGAFGAGGGGGGESGDGGDGGFGGGGGGQGGFGGFGGGGGSEEFCSFSPQDGQGGTFAGDGGGDGGGGGAGLGGAIFGYLAAIHVSNSTFVGNSAFRGHSGGDTANDGRGAGGAIFTVAGNLLVQSSTFSNNHTGEWTSQGDGTIAGSGGGGIVSYEPESDGNPATSEETTFVLRNSILAGNGPWECYTRNGVSMAGSAANIITDNGANMQGNPPCLGSLSSTDPGLGALTINAPGRTPTMAIGPTSNAVDAALGASPADDQRGILRPQGVASDIGAFELASTPPVTTITLAPGSPNGSNGWYTSAVGVSVTASDPDGSTISQTRCVLDPASAPATFADMPDAACGIASVGTDGEHTLYAASVDADGNVETTVRSAAFKVDATDPALAPTLNVSVVQVGQTGVVASPNASDATSGLASSSCGPVDTTTPGVNTVTCSATDNAGNTATHDLTYVVEYRILGFFSPVPESKWKVKQTVPVKIALGDAAGTRIDDAEAAALARACRVTFSATGAQPSSSKCLKYDAASDQFLFNWKLGKSPAGSATITVTISYPGSTVTTTLSMAITITG